MTLQSQRLVGFLDFGVTGVAAQLYKGSDACSWHREGIPWVSTYAAEDFVVVIFSRGGVGLRIHDGE